MNREDDYFLFFQEPNDPDFKKIIRILKLSHRDLSRIFDVQESGIRTDIKASKEQQKAYYLWGEILNLVGKFLQSEEKAVFWFQIYNPILKMRPIDLIHKNESHKLKQFVAQSVEQNKKAETK